jgi:hypothetical protein
MYKGDVARNGNAEASELSGSKHFQISAAFS